MWDTWMYFDKNTYYLYYLITEQSPGEGIGLAISKDGVNWQEKGTVLTKSSGAQWMGTGSVWKSRNFDKDGKFILNFSEWRGAAFDKGQQTIFFAQSSDLIHWQRFDAPVEFRPDTSFYKINQDNDSRWDCIYTIAGPDGSRYGYWSANPKDFHPGFGFGITHNDVDWQALPPPLIDWQGQPRMPVMEAGAVEKIGKKYYMMAATYRSYEEKVGMITFVADAPQGPFKLAQRNAFLLTSNQKHWNTYFARFFPTPKQLLVNHHAITRQEEKYFGLLKKAVVDSSGTLYLGYWKGNEKLKGKALRVPVPKHRDTVFVSDHTPVPYRAGLIMEGTITISERYPSAGLLIKTSRKSTLIKIRENAVTETGTVDPATGSYAFDEKTDRELKLGNQMAFRLIVSGSLLELYLDDYLIQCYSLLDTATDIGFLPAGAFDGVKMWQSTGLHQTLSKHP